MATMPSIVQLATLMRNEGYGATVAPYSSTSDDWG
ncbi:hypothetical protein PIIN_09347 [Serendipita indica DSM 11827]|uniref:Uncharacterized protein n=1 Tax=Serendipita indica (strain DSM 11827) TaxID=1109443 RepID=G4TVM0_SERID|nr:hypothetical protein PIIN_09347 [Serendipita indica DSM 11827]